MKLNRRQYDGLRCPHEWPDVFTIRAECENFYHRVSISCQLRDSVTPALQLHHASDITNRGLAAFIKVTCFNKALGALNSGTKKGKQFEINEKIGSGYNHLIYIHIQCLNRYFFTNYSKHGHFYVGRHGGSCSSGGSNITSTHNLYFRAKIRKKCITLYTPV